MDRVAFDVFSLYIAFTVMITVMLLSAVYDVYLESNKSLPIMLML